MQIKLNFALIITVKAIKEGETVVNSPRDQALLTVFSGLNKISRTSSDS